VTDIDGGDEMADVGRIEGAAEQADPRRRSAMTSSCSGGGTR
jgi:hypothetical protein